jgi:hypothetical protein
MRSEPALFGDESAPDFYSTLAGVTDFDYQPSSSARAALTLNGITTKAFNSRCVTHAVSCCNFTIVVTNSVTGCHSLITTERHLDYVTLHRAYVRSARNVWGDMIAKSEVVLYWFVSSVVAVFIGLAVVAPHRVDRTMMDILTRIVTAVAGN